MYYNYNTTICSRVYDLILICPKQFDWSLQRVTLKVRLTATKKKSVRKIKDKNEKKGMKGLKRIKSCLEGIGIKGALNFFSCSLSFLRHHLRDMCIFFVRPFLLLFPFFCSFKREKLFQWYKKKRKKIFNIEKKSFPFTLMHWKWTIEWHEKWNLKSK